jgi:hypothetical protein
MRRFVLVLIVSCLAHFCPAQDSSTGAIRGVVLDASAVPIQGATVALVNDATGLHYEQTSLLPPGEYSARAAADKMSPQLSLSIRVDIGGVAQVDFRLPIAEVREAITVSAEQHAVETQPAGRLLMDLRASWRRPSGRMDQDAFVEIGRVQASSLRAVAVL